MDTQRVRWVHVWTHREGEVGTYMDTQRVRWVQVWMHREG